MLAILMYLFEKFMDNSAVVNADWEIVLKELEQAGFSLDDIKRAFVWLEGLHVVQHHLMREALLERSFSIRHFTPEESEKLGIEGQGFLHYLERLSILNPVSREIVIDRLMAFEEQVVSLGRIKWVVLIVLFNQPDQRQALSVLQDMILSETTNVLH